MKGCLIYFLGFISGIIAIFLFSILFKFNTVENLENNNGVDSIASNEGEQKTQIVYKEKIIVKEVPKKSLEGLVLFEEAADCVSTGVFRVVEVVDEYYAIAEEVEYNTSIENYFSKYTIKVVIQSKEKNKFYDKQIIKLPSGKCMRQIGVYSKYHDTYPVVKISE